MRPMKTAICTLILLSTCFAYAQSKRPTTSTPVPPAAGRSTNGYILLADGSIHRDTDGPAQGLYVRGEVFVDRAARTVIRPIGDVQGTGKLGKSGHPGWMELNTSANTSYGNPATGTFYGSETAKVRVPPYIRGYKGSDGKFRPSSRKVVYSE